MRDYSYVLELGRVFFCFCFFFFKQKTAYEMRISDWSSDVCSSDLFDFHARGWFTNTVGLAAYRGPWAIESLAREVLLDRAARQIGIDPLEKIGRASCRERVCQSV